MLQFAGNLPHRLTAPWSGQGPMPFDLLGSTMDFPVSEETQWAAGQGMSQAVAAQNAFAATGMAWAFLDLSGVAGRGPIIVY